MEEIKKEGKDRDRYKASSEVILREKLEIVENSISKLRDKFNIIELSRLTNDELTEFFSKLESEVEELFSSTRT